MSKLQPDNLVGSIVADGDTGQTLKVNPDGSINVVGGGGALGAVKIEDRLTADRASVIDLSTLFTSLPPNTYGLVIGGEVFVVNDPASPFNIGQLQSIVDRVNGNIRNQILLNFLVAPTNPNVTTDTYQLILGFGVSDYDNNITNNLSIQVGNEHATNGLIYKIQGTIEGQFLVDIVPDTTLLPQQSSIIHIVDEKWADLYILAKRAVSGQDSQIRIGVRG